MQLAVANTGIGYATLAMSSRARDESAFVTFAGDDGYAERRWV
jgi:hypothetical protein